jgi:hypothetical protein
MRITSAAACSFWDAAPDAVGVGTHDGVEEHIALPIFVRHGRRWGISDFYFHVHEQEVL